MFHLLALLQDNPSSALSTSSGIRLNNDGTNPTVSMLNSWIKTVVPRLGILSQEEIKDFIAEVEPSVSAAWCKSLFQS